MQNISTQKPWTTLSHKKRILCSDGTEVAGETLSQPNDTWSSDSSEGTYSIMIRPDSESITVQSSGDTLSIDKAPSSSCRCPCHCGKRKPRTSVVLPFTTMDCQGKDLHRVPETFDERTIELRTVPHIFFWFSFFWRFLWTCNFWIF